MSFKPKRCEGCEGEFAPTSGAQRFCIEGGCKKERTKQRWREWASRQDREKFNEYQRRYRQRTNYGRDYELRTKYGITLEEWLQMLEGSNHSCQICGDDREGLCVDHDHLTGKVRGVLCRACNRSIGQLGDTLERLRKVVGYLEQAELGSDLQ